MQIVNRVATVGQSYSCAVAVFGVVKRNLVGTCARVDNVAAACQDCIITLAGAYRRAFRLLAVAVADKDIIIFSICTSIDCAACFMRESDFLFIAFRGEQVEDCATGRVCICIEDNFGLVGVVVATANDDFAVLEFYRAVNNAACNLFWRSLSSYDTCVGRIFIVAQRDFDVCTVGSKVNLICAAVLHVKREVAIAAHYDCIIARATRDFRLSGITICNNQVAAIFFALAELDVLSSCCAFCDMRYVAAKIVELDILVIGACELYEDRNVRIFRVNLGVVD